MTGIIPLEWYVRGGLRSGVNSEAIQCTFKSRQGSHKLIEPQSRQSTSPGISAAEDEYDGGFVSLAD